MTGAERREQLLDVTKAIVGEAGFHAVSIEAVARRAGITRPVVYGHFNDLSGLLEAMLARETARANAQLTRILPPYTWQGSSRELLLGALRGYLEAVRSDPVTWRLVLMPQEGAPEMLRDQIGHGRDAVLAVLAELVRPGFAPGRPPPDPELMARTLSALADEAARLILTDPEQFPIDRVMDHAAWLVDELVG
ncbi:MAG TPA: TetR/AcrR family transcriptional regulator [Solirubrobacteraceae bacterium]|jgi:AcrR family transcriptional regulator|nr:TetR/AcrR family transcriptional regulator [Solirubrobacteraceae bacterium]